VLFSTLYDPGSSTNRNLNYRPIIYFTVPSTSSSVTNFIIKNGKQLCLLVFRSFAKLLKVSIKFVMSACLSVRLSAHMEQSGSHWMEFHLCQFWVFFKNLLRKFNFHLNLIQITGTLREGLCTFMTVSHSVLLRMRNTSEKRWRENQKHILCSILVFRKSCLYGRAIYATDNNTAHALCMPDNQAYSHTFRTFNLLLSLGNKGYANAPQCCLISPKSVLLDYAYTTLRTQWLNEYTIVGMKTGQYTNWKIKCLRLSMKLAGVLKNTLVSR
jgi:hypothetical protein